MLLTAYCVIVSQASEKNHSCNTYLTNICEICYENINNGHIVDLVALDFRKAFDILNFDMLCNKLKLYGCNDKTVTWFISYFTGMSRENTGQHSSVIIT